MAVAPLRRLPPGDMNSTAVPGPVPESPVQETKLELLTTFDSVSQYVPGVKLRLSPVSFTSFSVDWLPPE
jgi:hypothetical protein